MSIFDALISKDYLKEAVWRKGRALHHKNPAIWRVDEYGNLIKYTSYGDRQCSYGWEMDHYPVPKSKGGLDIIENLRPLHWRINAGLGGLLK